MDPTTPSPDVISAIGSAVSTSVIQVVAAMLTPAIAWIALPSLFLIQVVKALWNQFFARHLGELNPETIWLIITPVCGSFIALFMWDQPAPHWIAAGCGAGLLANLFYAAILKRLIFRFAPKAKRINILKDRRRKQIKMRAGFKERRKDGTDQ